MKTRYDVIVIGAGPGGSWAAKQAADQGVSVLLLEKDRDIGVPVRCAEGVSKEKLKALTEVKPEWIAAKIRSTYLVAPNGMSVPLDIKNVGYVLHRRIFDYDLAGMAAQAGADVVTKACATGLILEGKQAVGVVFEHMGEVKKVGARVIIGADGVETRVGRWGGLPTHVHPDEMASCAQMTLSGIDVQSDAIGMYFGGTIAPGGYCWVFPKGEKSANVGLGIPAKYAKAKRPVAYLNEFIETRFPDASVMSTVVAGIPLTPPIKRMTGPGLMLVGDAAHQVNPLTGGGIVWAMKAGGIAGRVAAEAVMESDASAGRLLKYEKEWAASGGKKQGKYYRIKQAVIRFTDDELNRIAENVLAIDESKRTLFEVFKKALIKHPKLILEAAKLFVS
jgi:digeranylgeranylglycerophospholipid reductase